MFTLPIKIVPKTLASHFLSALNFYMKDSCIMFTSSSCYEQLHCAPKLLHNLASIANQNNKEKFTKFY